MRQDRKCSLCGWVIHGDDKLHEQRKKRHEGHHNRTTLSKNQIIGKVVWEAVW